MLYLNLKSDLISHIVITNLNGIGVRFEMIDFNNIHITLNAKKNKRTKQTKESLRYDTTKNETGCFFSLKPKNCSFTKVSFIKKLECPERVSFK